MTAEKPARAGFDPEHSSAASGSGAQHNATSRSRSGRSRRTSLFAPGKPFIWLTGGALVLGLALVIGLLGLILYFGLTIFWPQPVVEIVTQEGGVFMGESVRSESSRFDDVDSPQDGTAAPGPRTGATSATASGRTVVRRRLFHTGNARLTSSRFCWIDDRMVAVETAPRWALVVERLEGGRFYGFPQSFAFIEKTIANVDGAAGFRSLEDKRAEAGRLIRSLTPRRTDSRFGVLAMVREGVRKQRRVLAPESLDRAIDIIALVEVIEGESAVWELFEHYHSTARQLWSERRDVEVATGTSTATPVHARYLLGLRTAGIGHDAPHETLLRIDEIVRAYPANQLGFFDKVGVYLSRWWEYLRDEPREANREGGVFPAIVGTVILTLLLALIVAPFGVAAALYLREYAKAGPVVSIVRIAVNNLAGVPSIVFGVFGLGFFCFGVGGFIDGGPTWTMPKPAWFVLLGVASLVGLAAFTIFLKNISRPDEKASAQRRIHSTASALLWIVCSAAVIVLIATSPYFEGFYRTSLPQPVFGAGAMIWAALTMALLTLPVVIVATEEALAAVPNSMREGSYACGASRWQTVKRVVLPRALPGILTGMVLAMARGAGEVAPLMFVGAAKTAAELPLSWSPPFGLNREFMHLGFHIYDVGFKGQDPQAAKPMVFTATLLLIMIIAVLNIAAVWLRSRLHRRFVSSPF